MTYHTRWLRAPNLALAIAAAGAAAMFDARTPASAGGRPPAPWCASLGGRDGGFDCSYHTFDQCMATARGLGGFCAPNPWALYAPTPSPRRRAYR